MSTSPAHARTHESTSVHPVDAFIDVARRMGFAPHPGWEIEMRRLCDELVPAPTIGLGWDGIELLREAGETFRRYEEHHRRRAATTEALAGKCVTKEGREEFLRQAGEPTLKADANAEIAARIEAWLATPARFDQAEGPDDMTEAQRLIAGLVDCGPHPLLVKRARRWLGRAEAGRLGEDMLPLFDLEPEERESMISTIRLEADAVRSVGTESELRAWEALDRLIGASGPVAGRCRICGCDEDHACEINLAASVEGSNGARACGWADADRTLCDNPACVEQAGVDDARAAYEDDGCPKGDPGCLGKNGDCHDACESPVTVVASPGALSDLPPPPPPQVARWTIEVNGTRYTTDQQHLRGKLGDWLIEAMWDGKTQLEVRFLAYAPGPAPAVMNGKTGAGEEGGPVPFEDAECAAGWGEPVHPVDALKSFAQAMGGDLEPGFEAAARAHCDELVQPVFCGTCGANPADGVKGPPEDRVGVAGGFCPACHAPSYGGPPRRGRSPWVKPTVRRFSAGDAEPDVPYHFERRPPAEGLECAGTYRLVEAEPTADGLFPGDVGYDRDAASRLPWVKPEARKIDAADAQAGTSVFADGGRPS